MACALRIPDLAVDDRLALRVDLGRPARDLPERDQDRVRKSRDGVFVRLAHVDDLHVLAEVDPVLELDRRDLFDLRRSGRRDRLGRRDPAELLVVDELGDRRVRAAHRAVRVLAQLDLAETHRPRIEEQQAVLERLAVAQDQLDRLGRLDRADDPGEHAQHAALGARRHEAGRRRLGVEAAVARSVGEAEDAGLPLEAEDRSVDVGLSEQDAGVVDEIARREVVGPVGDDVVVLDDVEGVRRW